VSLQHVLEQGPVNRVWSTGVHGVHRHSSVDRPVDRSKEAVDWLAVWHTVALCWSRSTDRSTAGQDRSTSPVDRQANCFSWADSDFVSVLESNPI